MGKTQDNAPALDRGSDVVAEQEAKIAALIAENERLKSEQTAVRSALGKNDHTGKEVSGTFTVELEDAENGGQVSKTVKFQPGFVYCRIPSGVKVSSASLLKLANGEELSTEEAAANPELVQLGAKGAKSFLTNLVAKGASFLVEVGAMLALLILAMCLFPLASQAQFRTGEGPSYPTAETLTNADTAYFAVDKQATDRDAYDYIWHCNITESSGTATLYVTVQESMFASGTKWFTVSRDTITSSTQLLLKGNLDGIRQRVEVRTAGSGVYVVEPAVRYRRRTSF